MTSLKQRRVIISDDLGESSFSTEGVSVVIDAGIKVEEVTGYLLERTMTVVNGVIYI